MKNQYRIIVILFGLLGLFVILYFSVFSTLLYEKSDKPDWFRAYKDVEYQVNLGPRTPGSAAHSQLQGWLLDELNRSGWETEKQVGIMQNQSLVNIVARRGSGRPWIILGAHYDTRRLADNDPDPQNRNKPVPGANDGASGVAVLIELARVLPKQLDRQVWLVFFDAEDQGRLSGWDWILGSRYFVTQLKEKPDEVIVIDMIGDADLKIFIEQTGSQELSSKIWESARMAGYGQQFIPTPKYGVLDDHTPFLEKGISAVVIIDFDYPYWHTVQDTADKVSVESLKAVGETLLTYMLNK